MILKIARMIHRHKRQSLDLGIIVLGLLVAAFVCYEVDLFTVQGTLSVHQKGIDLDESLFLGVLFTAGMFAYSVRRLLEQKKEVRRRMSAEQQARELALQDPLTGLANRRQFDEALAAAVLAPPAAGNAHAVLLLDLNGFKRINDVHGHGAGDQVLIAVAHRLRGAIRGGHLVARLGGDEFVVLARQLAGAESATSIANRITQVFDEPVSVAGVKHTVGAAIGISLVPVNAETAADALRMADVALYRAKAERRTVARFFDPGMDKHVGERDQLESELRSALAARRIDIRFRPSFDLRTRRVVGFDAVPYWNHEVLGEVSPERFIPIAEDTGLVHELVEYTLSGACAAAGGWPKEITVGVAMFPSQLGNEDAKDRIFGVLGRAGLSPSRLEVHIAESALVQDLPAARKTLGELRAQGVRIALDNFGTGYSSLYHLRNVKLDKIKIDRRFVEHLGSELDETMVISALVGLGHGLGLTIAADGIESLGQQQSVLRAGCELGQGALYSKPLSVSEASSLLSQDRSDSALKAGTPAC
ncbi:MAG: EAL domain-containing protein [Gammaproteobacteria bacterium]|nr:EAL domain-containing protein [Gammaproteobacteria bacterium]MDE2263363.1 EAL domain-containing protein [Gammaproteobacteria bacterium]